MEIGTGTWIESWTGFEPTYSTYSESARKAATITGNVFGGGKGIADSFTCASAMIQGSEGTNITVHNGTIKGTVYGGGEIGRVENNTRVTIGSESGTGKPVVEGYVFGAGKGVNTHGYSALVRGNTFVTVQGNAKVGKSVYGGGEIASVGKYNIAQTDEEAAANNVEIGMPYSLVSDNRGICTVVVRGNAEIGPDNMKMYNPDTNVPDDMGHVFGAGRGVLPYEGLDSDGPKRMAPGTTESPDGVWEYYTDETKYLKYIETLALATQTSVTIGGNAFVKGSVYGGSENGHVQHDTHVTIQDNCQIGNGDGVNRRYTDVEWESESLAECAHWDYVPLVAAPYDPYAKYRNATTGKYYYDETYSDNAYAEGGSIIGSDGHTYYGNVFGGGSGLIPYAPGKWHRAAGSVGGNASVTITGGHILTSVYGGNEHTDVAGNATVTMTGGTLGVPRTVEQMKAHPVTCYLFGAGKGDQRIFFNTWTNVKNATVTVSATARIFGSIFGGGEDGHVLEDVVVNINSGQDKTVGTKTIRYPYIGTTGTSYVDGNVFGGGRGFSGEALTAGTIGGNVTVNIADGTMLGSIYGGGRLASVGTYFTNPEDPLYGQLKEDNDNGTYGHVTVNISGGTIGNDVENILVEHTTGGNVFGASMGRLTLQDGSINDLWPKLAQVKTATVNITGGHIKSNVYGGSELGTVREDTHVTIGGKYENGTVTAQDGYPVIDRDIYGGGYGSNDYTTHTTIHVAGYAQSEYTYTPMQWAGMVGGDTYVNILDGQVKKNIYGGGEMASVGIIDVLHAEKHYDIIDEGKSTEKIYGFGLSWPYKFTYIPYLDNGEIGGTTHVNITGGRIGMTGKDYMGPFASDGVTAISPVDGHELNDDEKKAARIDNGDVFGGGKGLVGSRYDMAFSANVRQTQVTININSNATPDNYKEQENSCLPGSVYGGGENGHVIEDTHVNLVNGLIGHAIYGGGKGKDTFTKSLLKIGKTPGSTIDSDYYNADIYSVTAGKVYGNTYINMQDGLVMRNIYGGGNMASVGKGNYAGGPDDYSNNGYGELPPRSEGNTTDLWSNTDFLNSGKTNVVITGGTVGNLTPSKPSDSEKDGLPYGNVFGGCRGEAAPNISETPRYYYSPQFYSGYVNETSVQIGTENSTSGPTILGSVYGGGQDGHVRRDTHVEILGGEIGKAYVESTAAGLVGTADVNNLHWLHRGNVYGAGSGIGKYSYDFNNDGDTKDTNVQYGTKPGTSEPNYVNESDYSTSAGSVTRFTKVEIKGGTIHRNVYGGGSLASIGAPKIPPITVDNYRKGDTEHGEGTQSINEVIISNGQIGDATSYDANGNHIYGGNVFGASRGESGLPANFATSIWTDVKVSGNTTTINGSVFGGGEVGSVKQGVDVSISGGNIVHDVYGGGALASTNTSAVTQNNVTTYPSSTINLTGGKARNVYGGGLGSLKFEAYTGSSDAIQPVPDVEAKSGNVNIELNKNLSSEKGFVVEKIFGGNNLAGTPLGDINVHVYATQHPDRATIANKVPLDYEGENPAKDAIARYDVQAVYGGGNLSAYIPTSDNAKAHVIIEGCDETSIYQVYGGGNAASVSATDLKITGAYEIYEAFGGGNGYDPFTLNVNGTDVTYPNPGANVGYKGYAHFEKDAQDNITAVDNADADTKEERQAQGSPYVYGTGIASTDIIGGNMHYVYGGSNSKGNIRTTALSVYEDASQCEVKIDETYGGGKNAEMDGEINMTLDCVKNMDYIYGGAKNANINNSVTVNITNGTFKKVFGGNNESGTINGDITVNVYEDGCQPIHIEELYGGGYLAPYSIYGYYLDENQKWQPRTKQQYETELAALGENPTADQLSEAGLAGLPHRDPQVNVISATEIGSIYGGGYNALVIGNPHVNINMEDGRIKQQYVAGLVGQGGTFVGEHYKDGEIYYTGKEIDTDGNGILAIGNIYEVYGGGNLANVDGSTYVEIGTGKDTDGNTLTRNSAMISGNVFGGGNNADVTENTYITVGSKDVTSNPDLFIEHSIYGGGNLGSVGTITSTTKHESLTDGFGLSWPYKFEYAENTGKTTINLYGGRIGLSGKDYFGPRDDDNKPIAINPDGSTNHELSVSEINEREIDNGDIFGGSKGQIGTGNTENIATYRYNEALLYNVRETEINIDMPTPDPDDIGVIVRKEIDGTKTKDKPALKLKTGMFGIAGSVYGGGEDGHVYENTTINIKGGYVGHAIYGGGKGKGMFKTTTYDLNNQNQQTKDVYSWIAGKVYGNTTINMEGGWVMRSIFGGGNLGSVGKGNYTGGADDYYAQGYGETLTGNLWDGESNLSQEFLNSGKSTVNIWGGKLGFLLSSTTKVNQAFDNTPETTVGSEYSKYIKACTKDDLPTGNVFGASRGEAVADITQAEEAVYTNRPDLYLGYVNETYVNIGRPAVGEEGQEGYIPASGPAILGSVYGGSMDGHVRRNTNVTVYKGEIGVPYNEENLAIMGAFGTDNIHWLHRGNVYGAGSGISLFEDGDTQKNSKTAGSVTHMTLVDIKSGIDGNAGGIIYRNVYGGGSLASVGSPVPGLPAYRKGDTATDHGIGKQTMSQVDVAGTIGHAASYATIGYGGDVNGGSRGIAALANDGFASSYHTQVNILPGAHILANAFGGGEAGNVTLDARVDMTGGTVDGNMFGGGDQADVLGNTTVNMSAGHVLSSIYGGGNMGSVGTITEYIDHNTKAAAADGALYDFALSWPVELKFQEGTGDTHVNITGTSRVGTSGDDNGDVFGGGKGMIGIDWAKKGVDLENGSAEDIIGVIDNYRYEEARTANVNNTYVTVNLPFSGDINGVVAATKVWDTDDREAKKKLIIDADYEFYDNDETKPGHFTRFGSTPAVTGSVYGGSENGHVNGDTHLTLIDGIVGHALYGGGKGKGTYQGRLYNLQYAIANQFDENYQPKPDFEPQLNDYIEDINSLTSGKVYGNTNVTMKNGYVMRSIFGGGNLGSVGKGNYSGGTDDYSLIGYGERPESDNDPLWDTSDNTKLSYQFMNSGKTSVVVEAGQVGFILSSGDNKDIEKLARKDDLPTGNVFGACRGQVSPNGNVSPRYLYIPDFFLGYVNETEVIIGTANGRPKILGSVYGGGQDGHVRRGTTVTVNNAEIGITYNESNRKLLNKEGKLVEGDYNSLHWKGRGNVFGAGSGIGTYNIKDPVTGVVAVDDEGEPINTDYNYSSGSVTCTTRVTINNGALLHQNVYGGGSLASVGPPNTGQVFAEYNTTEPYTAQFGRNTNYLEHKSTSSTNVIINGGSIGEKTSFAAGYGGNVFGASRGNFDNSLNLGENAPRYATSIWTNVEARNGQIFGNVFGGGESGSVTMDTKVIIGGEVPQSTSNGAQIRVAPQPAVQSQQTEQQAQPAAPSGQQNVATEAPVNRSVTRNRADQ